MAQTLKFGKGTWATKTGSSMAYNDQNGNYKPLPFNVERDSIATRVNKEGLIEVVGKDKLRIDYTDSAKGVALLEPSRTNYLTQSNQFDTTWNLQNITISSNETGVGGSVDAWKLIPSTANTYHRITNTVSGTQNLEVTLSVYAKADGYNFLRITENGSTGDYATFNLLDGIVENNTSSAAKIESVGNGWYRCSSSIVATTSHRFDMYVMESATVQEPWQGNGTSGVYIQYAQLEQGDFATSYIPTSGSTVQRQADVVNGSGNSEVLNDSEGVLFADYKPTFAEGSRQITLNDNTYDNRIILECRENGTKLRAQISDGGANQMEINFVIPSIDLYYKCAIKYKANDGAFWINGFKIDVDTNMSVPSGMNNISFSGRNDTSLKMTGKTKEVGYYDATLTDSELEYLTSYRSLNELVTELNLNTL